MNTEVSHEQGFFDDGSNDSIGYFGTDGRVEWNTQNENDYQYNEGIYYDDSLMRKAIDKVGDKRDEYGLLWFGAIGKGKKKFNCQDYCDALREEYQKLFEKLSPSEQLKILEKKMEIEAKWKEQQNEEVQE